MYLNPRPKMESHWRRHGIKGASVMLYDALLDRQKGQCKLCHTPPKQQHLALDHDHKTGKIRGLLCYRCNMLIGQLEVLFAVPKQFEAMLEYIRTGGGDSAEEAQQDIVGFNPELARPYVAYRQQKALECLLGLLGEGKDRQEAIREVAAKFGVTTRTIRNYLSPRKIPI